MRFNVFINVEENKLPMDYRRMTLAFLKFLLSHSNKEYYQKNYESGAVRKEMSFATYLPFPKFHSKWEENENRKRVNLGHVEIKGNQYMISFTIHDHEFGIYLLSAFMTNEKTQEKFKYKDYTLYTADIRFVFENPVFEKQMIYTTLSPVLIRDHNPGEKDWYYSFTKEEEQEKAFEVFKRNLQNQIADALGGDAEDYDSIKIKILNPKTLSIYHYEMSLPANQFTMIIEAEPKIQEYLYNSGIGSGHARGFGMLKIRGL